MNIGIHKEKNMKPGITAVVILLSGATLCHQAQAETSAGSTTLTVSGTLAVSSCTPALDNGGVLDYGRVPVSTLFSGKASGLEMKDINLNITCSAPTRVGFTVRDNENDSEQGTGGGIDDTKYGFGMGYTAGGVKIGHYYIYLKGSTDATADGSSASPVYSQDGGASWQAGNSSSLAANDNSEMVSLASLSDPGTPEALTSAVIPLTVHPVVQDSDLLAITDDTPFKGSATFTLVYL